MICNSLILEHLYMSTLAGCVPSALGATAGSVEGREVGSDAKQSWGELPRFMLYISLYMYIYVFTRAIHDGFFISRSMVAVLSRVFDVVEVLQLAVNSNWFGLACPHHCHPSSLPSLALAFVLGLTLGFLSGCFLAFYLFRFIAFGFGASGSTLQSAALTRRRGYIVRAPDLTLSNVESRSWKRASNTWATRLLAWLRLLRH